MWEMVYKSPQRENLSTITRTVTLREHFVPDLSEKFLRDPLFAWEEHRRS